MNVHLTYHSGQSYSEYFSDFGVKVSAHGNKRIKVAIRQKEPDTKGYASLSLPVEKAQQLAYAILAASPGNAEPIEFSVEEQKPKVVAA